MLAQVVKAWDLEDHVISWELGNVTSVTNELCIRQDNEELANQLTNATFLRKQKEKQVSI